MDRNDYYGGASASLTLNQVWFPDFPARDQLKWCILYFLVVDSLVLQNAAADDVVNGRSCGRSTRATRSLQPPWALTGTTTWT